MTPNEQYRLNTCYVNLKAALDELAQIQHKDSALTAVQHKLYAIEDTLHQYIGPIRRDKNGQHENL